MSVRVMYDEDGKRAALYCSTTEFAFGPVFRDSDTRDAREEAEAFLSWYAGKYATDLRNLDDMKLGQRVSEWRATR